MYKSIYFDLVRTLAHIIVERQGPYEHTRKEICMPNESVKLDTLHDVFETARRLGLKPSTVRRMILEKEIDVFRPGKRAVRISERTIQEKLAKGFTPAVLGR